MLRTPTLVEDHRPQMQIMTCYLPKSKPLLDGPLDLFGVLGEVISGLLVILSQFFLLTDFFLLPPEFFNEALVSLPL